MTRDEKEPLNSFPPCLLRAGGINLPTQQPRQSSTGPLRGWSSRTYPCHNNKTEQRNEAQAPPGRPRQAIEKIARPSDKGCRVRNTSKAAGGKDGTAVGGRRGTREGQQTSEKLMECHGVYTPQKQAKILKKFRPTAKKPSRATNLDRLRGSRLFPACRRKHKDHLLRAERRLSRRQSVADMLPLSLAL